MVEIFKTNIDEQQQAEVVLKLLCKKFPDFKINFDYRKREDKKSPSLFE